MRTSAPAAAPIFRSDQQMRVLGVLFARRGVELSVSDVAHQAGVAVATASREIERLQTHRIVLSRHVGRTRLVSANWELPWADALALILAHSVGLPGRIGSTLSRLKGIERIFIYGSWAARFAGEVGGAPRDIDLLVVGDVDVAAVRKALRPLEKDLGLEVNPVVVSHGEWEDEGSAFMRELRSRPIFAVSLSAPAHV